MQNQKLNNIKRIDLEQIMQDMGLEEGAKDTKETVKLIARKLKTLWLKRKRQTDK